MNGWEKLCKEFREFRDKRDWKKYHIPKDVSLALFIEMGEIAENFLWKTPREIEELKRNYQQSEMVADELADVLFYLISLADSLDIDLIKAGENKLRKNREKYPCEKVKGKAYKYTHYRKSSADS